MPLDEDMYGGRSRFPEPTSNAMLTVGFDFQIGVLALNCRLDQLLEDARIEALTVFFATDDMILSIVHLSSPATPSRGGI